MDFTIIAFIVGCEAVGILSGLWGGSGNTSWYRSLRKPPFQPPSWLFGPVWIILYGLMGYAGYLVYAEPSSLFRTGALALFGVQLLLNFLWTPLFFRFHMLGYATAELLALIVVLGVTVYFFARLVPLAAFLLVPYFVWVCFASMLSLGIWRLNR